MAQHGISNGKHVPHDSGHSVGSTEDAVKVRALEDEVSYLAEKANNASQRFADYENEIRVLQAKLRQQQRQETRNALAAETADDGAPAAAQADRPGISRFGSFMHSRKATNGAVQQPASRERELEASLVKEQTLRIAAEKKAKDVSAEIEELSASLFQQANEMVATERKENAALSEKIQALEAQAEERSMTEDGCRLQRENVKLRDRVQVLEKRDADRRRRLEKLEAANERIEKVRTLLIPR